LIQGRTRQTNNKRKRARLTGRHEEFNHLLQVGTEVGEFSFCEAVDQRPVDGKEQSLDHLLKIDNKKEELFQGRIRNG
jgi:hypothetical protein